MYLELGLESAGKADIANQDPSEYVPFEIMVLEKSILNLKNTSHNKEVSDR